MKGMGFGGKPHWTRKRGQFSSEEEAHRVLGLDKEHLVRLSCRVPCQICGAFCVPCIHEGQVVCSSCLAGLADSTPAPVGGEWELVGPYGVCGTYKTEEEARKAVEYAASRSVTRTYRKAL